MKSERGSQSLLGLFGVAVCSALALVLAQAAGTLVEQRQLGNLANAVALDTADLLKSDSALETNQQALRNYASSTLLEMAKDPRSLDLLKPRISAFQLQNTQKIVLQLCADSRFANSLVTSLMPSSLAEVCVATAAQNVASDNF